MTNEPILMQFDCKSPYLPMSTLSSFGNIDYSKGSSDNNYQFTGKEIDPGSGLTLIGDRFLDPEIGRWYSRDRLKGEIINPQTLNRYQYALNNPLKYIDLTGLKEVQAAALASTWVGKPYRSSRSLSEKCIFWQNTFNLRF